MNHIALYLKDIFFGKKTGCLTFSRSGIEKSFIFQDGGLLFAKTNVSEERLGEILYRTGKIAPDVFSGINKYVRPDTLLGEALVQNRVLTQRALYDGVLAQMYAVTLGCFVFFDGVYSFQPQERYIDAEFQLRVSLPLLIEKGVRAMAFHPAIHSFFSGKTLTAKEGPLLTGLDERERALWSRMDGTANIEYIMTWDAADPNWFWKTMFLLYTLGLADFKEVAPTVTLPEPPSQPKPEPLPPPPAPPASPTPSQFMTSAEAAADAAEPLRPASAPAADAAAREINETIAEAIDLRKRMGNLDHYQLFGIPSSAGEAEVKKAYFKLARKFHPDRFGRSLDPQLKVQIDELFDRITKSYKALTTPGAAAVPPEPPPPADEAEKDPGRNADTRFRQGKTLYSQARYEEAIQYLEEAVRMNDNKGDYFLLLALAQSKVRGFSKKAEKNFLRAIELEPWNPEGIVGLGLLYKKEGMTTRARKQFERAVEIEPNHQAAKSELELIDGKSEDKKGKGFFSGDLFGSKKKK
ncbi:MAG: DnaJ domain-containing protein [Candidatus Aminicenantes bacterium]|nr:DnaJ domain-containing protein [Candidatus Aminicenantes bacterium]